MIQTALGLHWGERWNIHFFKTHEEKMGRNNHASKCNVTHYSYSPMYTSLGVNPRELRRAYFWISTNRITTVLCPTPSVHPDKISAYIYIFLKKQHIEKMGSDWLLSWHGSFPHVLFLSGRVFKHLQPKRYTPGKVSLLDSIACFESGRGLWHFIIVLFQRANCLSIGFP